MNIWKEYEGKIKELNAKMFGTLPYGTRRQTHIIFDNTLLKVGDIYDIYIINSDVTVMGTITCVHQEELEFEFYRHGEKHRASYGGEGIKILLKHTPSIYVDTTNPPYGGRYKFTSDKDNKIIEEK